MNVTVGYRFPTELARINRVSIAIPMFYFFHLPFYTLTPNRDTYVLSNYINNCEKFSKYFAQLIKT